MTDGLYDRLNAAAARDPTRRFYSLIDKVASEFNVINAVSKLPTKELREKVDVESIRKQLLSGIAPPQWYHTAQIPKRKCPGERRKIYFTLSPDEVVRQNAVKQVVEPIFEACFKDCSYAYRKGKGALKALQDIKACVDSGYHRAVKLDVRRFFDSIQYRRLMSLIEGRIADGRLLSLIDGVIRTGYLEHGKHVKPDAGILQGMALSPLLSNVFLNVLDTTWCNAGHEGCRMFRYSDDILIVGRSRYDVEKALDMVGNLLHKLFLTYKTTQPINLGEGTIDFLGFVNTMAQGCLSQMPTPQALQYMEAEILEEIQSGSDKLKQKIDGWMNFYGINVDASRLVQSVICNATGGWSLLQSRLV